MEPISVKGGGEGVNQQPWSQDVVNEWSDESPVDSFSPSNTYRGVSVSAFTVCNSYALSRVTQPLDILCIHSEHVSSCAPSSGPLSIDHRVQLEGISI